MAGRVKKRLMDLSCLGQPQYFNSVRKVWLVIGIVLVASFGAPAQKSSTTQPASAPTIQPTPLPQVTPFSTPSLPVSPALPSPTPPTAPSQPALRQTAVHPELLTLDEALRLSSSLASNFQQASLNEQIAAEDVRQAQAAFLPHVSAPLGYLYTSPALGLPPGTPRAQSFIANNAISEYQAYVNIAGDFDIAGRLRATLAKNRALLEAAHAGTEIARRALVQAVIEAYYGLALATAQRGAAEQNLLAAEEFERITSLLLSGGEVASVDFTRAQLQTIGRRDELERAKANEIVAAGSLRVLVGYEFTRPINTTELGLAAPVAAEFQQLKASDISSRPEFTQFEAQVRAAKQEVKIARADRLPQLSYSILGGLDTDSLRPPRLKEHTGVSGAISLTIPIFDWGASRSRERQARLREQIAENERTIALRGFTEQFYSAQAQVASAIVRIRLAGAGITQAQANLDASTARYRAGEAQIIEVTDALTTLATQRLALNQAIFDYQTALARLRQAAGQ
jgi:outer membrane protein TolC